MLKISVLNEHELTVYADVKWIKFDNEMERIYFYFNSSSVEIPYSSADLVLVDGTVVFENGTISQYRLRGY